MVQELWVEKYRPASLDGYVFTNDSQKTMIQKWIHEKSFPHLLLTGRAGTGKTTLAKILLNELGIHGNDILELNSSSRESRGIAAIESITSFVSTTSFGDSGLRVVLMDEADQMTRDAQLSLRNMMETYSATSRFVLTGNHAYRIDAALKSRCTSVEFQQLDKDKFYDRIGNIIVSENIVTDFDALDTYVQAAYPDLRKCISLIQNNCVNGELLPVSKSSGDANLKLLDLIKKKKIIEARIMVCEEDVGDIAEIYKFIFKHLDDLFSENEQREEAILELRTGIVNHTLVADPEINLAATLVRLARILG